MEEVGSRATDVQGLKAGIEVNLDRSFIRELVNAVAARAKRPNSGKLSRRTRRAPAPPHMMVGPAAHWLVGRTNR